ncbi:hypothetical protein MLD38_031753 [Melastoma candidum]|uniref:Uncharacterized protein n=1 Tax=Melastoma candidum TaxID=119954 RepID=A0ACB9MQN8_9MYRT|nr:hypothetical protein MLD38_031753 [Melastoma candidum]
MAIARKSRCSNLVISLLGLGVIVLACLVGGGECRRVVYGDMTGRRSLVVVEAGGPVAGGPVAAIPDEDDDYESTEDDQASTAGITNLVGPTETQPASNVPAPVDGVFDATRYGAKADKETDNALAFIRTWNAACKSGKPAKMVIPSGTYVAGPVVFQGPCNNGVPMEIEIQGTIKSYSDISAYTSEEWFSFELIDGLNVKGGVFDGQGQNFWAYAGCDPRKPCQHLPTSLRFGKVKNIYVEGLTVRNPIIIDQNYGYHKITKPSSVKIHDVTFRNIRGTTVSSSAVSLTCSSKNPCQSIQLADIDLEYNGPPLNEDPFGSSCVNAKITVVGTHNPPACS